MYTVPEMTAGRTFLLRTYLRGGAAWNRLAPLRSAKGLIGKLDPLMSRLGLLDPVWLEVEPGIKMLLDPADQVGSQILGSFRTRWEPWVWDALSSGIGEGDVVLDVGAHIGYATLKSSLRVGASG
jgi:hypothetical protein